MVFTNRFLSFLLIFVLLISGFSFIFGLEKIDSLGYTAKVVDTAFGSVSIEIERVISITTKDGNHIDFTSCVLLEDDFVINSEGAKDTFEACPNYQVMNLSVRNNGDAPVSVYISSNVVGGLHGGSFLASPSSTSDLLYKVSNTANIHYYGPGCEEGFLGPSNYTSFEVPDEQYVVCEILNTDIFGGQNSVIVNFELVIPSDVALGYNSVVVEFTAQEYFFP